MQSISFPPEYRARVFRVAKNSWAIVVVIAVFFVIYKFQEPESIRKETEARREFDSIVAIGGSQVISQRSTHKPGSALVSVLYSSSFKSDDVREYYFNELLHHGWLLDGTTSASHNAQIHTWCFSKRDLAAYYSEHIQPPGDLRFELAISWGVQGC
ncbi:MAG: hypothetical protein HYX26_11125 [Acidobacteriales bacterium]|nr:hypothetical protein [Terriglobales bacterium]